MTRPNDSIVPFVALSPTRMPVGASWIVIGDWMEAAAAVFGDAVALTSDPARTIEQVRELATLASKGRSHVSRLRRAVPETLVTAAKDARAFARSRQARIRATAVEGRHIPFVWQHHSLFQRQGIELARRRGVPVVVAVEALQVREAQAWGVRRPVWGSVLERFGERASLDEADLITCVSAKLAESVEDLGVDPNKILVTPNRTNVGRFRDADRDAARKKLGVEGKTVVGWVGSFRSYHGLEVLMDAHRNHFADRDDVVFVLGGDGPEHPTWRAYADEVGGDRVRLPGMVAYHDIPSLIAAFDIAVIPARAGQDFHYSPLKLHEYMAADVPAVVPRIGQLTELDDGKQALLFDPGDSAQLARHIDALATNDGLRESIVAGASSYLADCGDTRDLLLEVCRRLGVPTDHATAAPQPSRGAV